MIANDEFGWTINLVNSIIGVSLLSMPFCFKKCGIVLSIVLILLSALLNRFSCYLLLKSAIIAKRRNYELLAFHTFGSTGKLMVELSVLGFLLGTCIAFFVVIGDIGPSLVSQLFGVSNGPQLRAFVMTFLGMFVALPLGLLRRVDSLTSFSMLSFGLYVFLVIKMFSEAFDNISDKKSENVWQRINYWDSSHVFSSVPIFSMALSCQTQLFAIFDSSLLHNNDSNTLQRMSETVNRSLNICSAIYISVGISGYIAFWSQPFGGNILLILPSGFISTFTLIAFVFTVLISFPLCLFPCRTSLHSLLSKKGTTSFLSTASPSIHMSDRHFKILTVVLIVTTIGISILLPYIEFVLGILGSTIGAVICFIFPALIFINLTAKNTTERIMAQFVVIIGSFILIICTFSTLNEICFVKNTNLIENIETSKLLPLNRINENPVLKKSLIDKTYENKQSIRVNGFPNELRVPLPSMDANKVKRQEELLQRLEKQQIEHKKLLEQQKELFNEMKKHNQLYHSLENKKLVVNEKNPSNNSHSNDFIKTNDSINNYINDSKQQIINSNNNKNEKSIDKPLVLLSKRENITKDSVVLKSKPSDLSNKSKQISLNEMKNKKYEQKTIEKYEIKPNLNQKLNENKLIEKNISNNMSIGRSALSQKI